VSYVRKKVPRGTVVQGDDHPVVVRYPELAYRRIGYATDAQLETMAANLDAMEEAERRETLDKVERDVPGVLTRLAGLPWYGDMEEGETVPTHVTLALCPHCNGRGRISIVHDEIGEGL
jgi:hypothetical protein